ncbi:putative EF-hand domain-containing protein [Helianthus annuus]|nr:putative EF-hand domain-containing protein [Helianthus annuus]KAJ0696600.1 putative EF-hand domain-containing protein [Helianthus annuus]
MAVNTDKFKLYFKRADVDQDGRVSGSEAVSFFQASGLSKPVLAQDHVVRGLISVRFRSVNLYHIEARFALLHIDLAWQACTCVCKYRRVGQLLILVRFKMEYFLVSDDRSYLIRLTQTFFI